jgi:hypothetical protein
MKSICTDAKNFDLYEGDKKLGKLSYKNYFPQSAEIQIDDASSYQIKPTNFLSTSYMALKKDREIATFKMNLNGQMVIDFIDEQKYIFKRKSMLNSKYIIENNTGREIIRFMPSFNWAKFKYSYDIVFEDKPDILLILIGMFCTNYYIAMSGGVIIEIV